MPQCRPHQHHRHITGRDQAHRRVGSADLPHVDDHIDLLLSSHEHPCDGLPGTFQLHEVAGITQSGKQ
ncbi:hypothetical protein DMB42_35525 [Nonomuraea sp. WAC 01424]|nr:hypothetical protein DMB42_35525 [Nonomuraea sp. WAC 01424]